MLTANIRLLRFIIEWFLKPDHKRCNHKQIPKRQFDRDLNYGNKNLHFDLKNEFSYLNI